MEKKDWKKMVLGLVSVSTVLLAACGGGEEATETDAENAVKDGESATLKIDVDPRYSEYVNEIIPAFEEEHSVTIEISERDMFEGIEALPLDGPADIGSDILIAPYDRVGVLGQQGHLAEVTLPDDGRYDELDQRQVTLEDKIYGAPFVIESLVLYYNKDLLKQAPETFEDLEKMSEDDQYAFENEEETNTAFLANWTTAYQYIGLLSGYGGYVFGEDGTDPTDIGLNSPKSVEGISYIANWYQDVWPQGMLDATSSENFMNELFTSGKTAAVINGPWGASGYDDAGVNYGVSTIPILPNGSEYEPFAGGVAWAVSKYSKNPELAQEWLDYVTNAENSETLYEVTSEIPANQEARAVASESGNELTKAVIEQFDSAVPMPNIPEMSEVWTGAETLIFDAASGNKTPQQAADDAVQLIEENIAQKYQK
ncbi:extracellular solute-binding protein [Carnobacterium alterfunditum]|uniref:extracellular solute-binding protein n=1 Tax=Carnobacterium alterfunditum TaxID=28230 RepID=UPI001B80CEAB|nr:extracellular solute-binding protein [Carnobacterium alterfunditum]